MKNNPERTLIRAKIMSFITGIIEERGLTQSQAAKILKLTQPKVSNLINGKLSMFSKPKSEHETVATTSALVAS